MHAVILISFFLNPLQDLLLDLHLEVLKIRGPGAEV